MEINYLELLVKKDIQIDELKKRIEDKEYECGILKVAHDGLQLRERHQNGEIRELEAKYNKMMDLCRTFDQSFRLLSIAIYNYLECKDDSYDLKKEYERVLKDHEDKTVGVK